MRYLLNTKEFILMTSETSELVDSVGVRSQEAAFHPLYLQDVLQSNRTANSNCIQNKSVTNDSLLQHIYDAYHVSVSNI